MLQPWTALPEAACLLASCAANPPVHERKFKTYVITRDEWVEYNRADKRVAALDAIRDKFMDEVWTPALANMEANGGRDVLWAACVEVDEAIDVARECGDLPGQTLLAAE